MKKRICFVSTVGKTLKTFVLEFAKYLHQTGEFEVSFLCNPDEELLRELPEYIRLFPVEMDRGISVSGFRAADTMYRIFRRERFDMVQYSTPNAACYAAIAANRAKIPVRLYCQWGIAYVGFSGIKRLIFKEVEKLVCRLSTQIEPDSYGNLRFGQKEGLYPETKGSVVWNGSACGVSLTKFDVRKKEEFRKEIRNKYGVGGKDFVFGFVGRITRDKGIDELLSAMQHFVKKGIACYLLLVGDEESDKGLDTGKLDWAKKNHQILFCGHTEQVEKYLAAMDCFVMPSYREGFGMSVVEAEAMKVPVIVTDIPGPTDAMSDGETGLIVKKADVDSLCNAMERLFYNKDEAITLGERGYTLVKEKFEQSTLFEKMLNDRKLLLGIKEKAGEDLR